MSENQKKMMENMENMTFGWFLQVLTREEVQKMVKRQNLALLYKEHLAIRKILRGYLGLFCSYMVCMVLGLLDFVLMLALGQMIPFMVGYALFYQDEKSGFPEVLASYPYGQSAGVSVRYGYTLLWTVVITISFLITFAVVPELCKIELGTTFIWLLGVSSYGLTLCSIIFPITYQYGTTKGKTWYYLIVLTTFAFFLLAYRYLVAVTSQDTQWNIGHYKEEMIFRLLGVLLMSLVAFGCSYRGSLQIVGKKSYDYKKEPEKG